MVMMMKANYDAGANMVAEQSMEIPSGEQEIVSNVTISYELR
jgi:hypothetical protein